METGVWSGLLKYFLQFNGYFFLSMINLPFLSKEANEGMSYFISREKQVHVDIYTAEQNNQGII